MELEERLAAKLHNVKEDDFDSNRVVDLLPEEIQAIRDAVTAAYQGLLSRGKAVGANEAEQNCSMYRLQDLLDSCDVVHGTEMYFAGRKLK